MTAVQDLLTEARALRDAHIETGVNTMLETATAPLRDRITELESALAECQSHEPVQPVARPRTMFGACPGLTGGGGLSAALRVPAKYGNGTTVRQFQPGGFTAPSVDPRLGPVHTSYKPNLDQILSGALDEQIAATAAAARPGDILEVWHEADKKARDGQASVAKFTAVKNHFYDVVKATKPEVLVAVTHTAWLFEPKSRLDPSPWADVKADVLGIDCDGVNVTALPYPNYDDEIAGAVAFASAVGYPHWAVPEFGVPRVDAYAKNGIDADGIVRTAWAVEYARKFEAAGALYVHWFDYNADPGYELTTPAEVGVWAAIT